MLTIIRKPHEYVYIVSARYGSGSPETDRDVTDLLSTYVEGQDFERAQFKVTNTMFLMDSEDEMELNVVWKVVSIESNSIDTVENVEKSQ